MDRKSSNEGAWVLVGVVIALAATRPDLLRPLVNGLAWLLWLPVILLGLAILWWLARMFWQILLAVALGWFGGQHYGDVGLALGIATAGWVALAEAWWSENYGKRRSASVAESPTVPGAAEAASPNDRAYRDSGGEKVQR